LFGFVKHWRIGLLGVAVSLLALYFIVSELDFDLLGDALSSARFVYLIPGILLTLAGLLARAFRWQLLLSGSLPLMRSFHIMNIAYLVNGVLPLRIGELSRAYLASRSEQPVPVLQSISTVIVERLLDLLAVVMMLAFALVSGPVPGELRAAGAFFGITGLVGFLFLVFLSHQRHLANRILSLLVVRFRLLQRLNLRKWLGNFLDGLLPLTHTRTLFLTLAWTAVSWGFSACAGYVLMYTFYDRANWVATCLYISAASFAIAVPITMGNLGVYEASIVLALMALDYGETETQAIAFAVTVHATNVGINAVTGIIGFIREGITLAQLSAGVREVTEAEAVEIPH
jgi:uncharacterized protein (TIRG00374 family)